MPLTSNATTPLLLAAAALGDTGRTVAPGVVARTFQSILTGTATVVIEVSNDPLQLTWFTLFTHTVNSAANSTSVYKYVRARVTAYTSGTITVYMAT